MNLRFVELLLIKTRCSQARPGPWVSFIEGRNHTSGSNFIKVGEGQDRSDDIELSGVTVADQDFIAHARSDIPTLLEEVMKLRRLLQITDDDRPFK